LAVGLAVGLTVGWAVALGVGAGVGLAVGWVGADVGAAVGFAGRPGDATSGVEADAAVGLAPTGMADGVTEGEAVGAEPDGAGDSVGDKVSPAGGDCVVPAVGVLPPVGVAVGTTAIRLGAPLALARCCSSTPPMLSAIVARTIFRTPRLRMSRAR
jgi:hypothetical protein